VGELTRVTLGHGAGGQLTAELIRDVFVSRLGNSYLETLSDSAIVPSPGERLALTTDGFVVTPLFFPGGDIGRLAVCGTVNDLAVAGAQPVYLTASFIIEEGLPVDDLVRVVDSMAAAATEAGAAIVAGDTKVVERDGCDRLFVVTSGLGRVLPGVDLGPGRVRRGDRLVLSGPVGLHGVAVMSQRPGVAFTTNVRSDCAPVSALTRRLLAELGPEVRWMRDPTRGGLATVAAELGQEAGCAVLLEEESIPVDAAVRAACEMLGLDPLYVANEGRFVAVVAVGAADRAVEVLRRAGQAEAGVIGRIDQPEVAAWAVLGAGAYLRTTLGGTRPLPRLAGEQLPRIC
jgi:hydrogenase expression/formation protein HypE